MLLNSSTNMTTFFHGTASVLFTLSTGQKKVSNLDKKYILIFNFKKKCRVGTRFATLTMSGAPFMEAWNECSLELVDAVRAHCFFVMVEQFTVTVSHVENDNLRKALHQLCSFFAVSQMIDQPWNGLIHSQHSELIQEASNQLLHLLRPNCVAFVDAFDFPDRVLNSTIGSYDGNVYERLYESARRSTLNRRDPFDGYYEHLRPRLDLEFLKQGNKVPSKL